MGTGDCMKIMYMLESRPNKLYTYDQLCLIIEAHEDERVYRVIHDCDHRIEILEEVE
jgi:hypothetical protein